MPEDGLPTRPFDGLRAPSGSTSLTTLSLSKGLSRGGGPTIEPYAVTAGRSVASRRSIRSHAAVSFSSLAVKQART